MITPPIIRLSASGHLPSARFGADANWWGIIVLAFNLNSLMKRLVLPKEWSPKRLKAIRITPHVSKPRGGENDMEKEVDELRRVPGRVPRLTSEGIDFTGVPIDMVIKQAMAGSEVEFSGALGSAGNASGRHDYIGCAFYR